MDIVDQLNEGCDADVHDVKRCNALLMCLCQEAAEEIRALRIQIAKDTNEICNLRDAVDEIRRITINEIATLCDELTRHYSDYSMTALLNGDVELSNAASGEPRASAFIAEKIREML